MSDTGAAAPHRKRRIIVALTGASGATYGVRAMQLLRRVPDIEIHLILTAGGRATLAYETDVPATGLFDLADVVHRENDLAASISSGSFVTEGMLVAPCSIRTLSGIANAYDENLVVRAADVVLKERRRLVLMVRETPLHATHLRLMSWVTEAGAIVAPPVPAFYHRPETVDDIVDQTVGRVLDLLDMRVDDVTSRWAGGTEAVAQARTAL
jgi:4-hydroxy-3-polyprenylbenzoate decarboxylase